MFSARLLLVGVFLSVLGPFAFARGEKGCYAGRGEQSTSIQGFSIRVFRHPHADEEKYLDECLAEIKNATGELVFSDEDHGLKILPISGTDINGDGDPDAVIEGYTGGAHCCWDYWMVSLGSHPGLLAHLYNERAASFTKTNDGKVLIETLDGRFDYFDGLSHKASVFPRVYLRLSGKHLEEVNSEFRSEYLKDVEYAQKSLIDSELVEFRQSFSPGGDRFPEGYEDTRQKVLTVVLAYLYSGKPEEAWQYLDAMWPPADKERIRKLILKTRGNGLANRRD